MGGRRDLMEQVAPVGPMYQAGTLSGNPLAMAAGIATLQHLRSIDFQKLKATCDRLDAGIRDAAKEHGIELVVDRVGTMSGMYFLPQKPKNWSDVEQANKEQFKVFFHSMLDQGVFYAPSPFEAAFISTVHTDTEVNLTIEAARNAFQQVAQSS